MDTGREALEGGFRLRHVKRAKLYLFLVQIIIVLSASIYLALASNEVQVKPFFLPVGSFLYFVILVGLIICAEGFVFRALEMRYTKSSSTKYYVVKTSVRRSVVGIAICFLIICLLVTPFLSNAIANIASGAGQTTTTASFYNRDPLGLTSCDQVYVASNLNAEVMIVSEANYELYSGNMNELLEYSIAHTSDAAPGVYLNFPDAAYGMYVIIVDSNVGATVHYTVHKTLDPTFVDFVTVFSAAFIALFAGWIAYLVPLRRKFSKGAIYR